MTRRLRRDIHPAATEYTVNVIGEADRERYPEYYHWDVKVTYRGKGLWSVRDLFLSYSRWGIRHWHRPRGVYEPRPSERSDYYIRTYRFSLGEALDLAVELAQKMTVNGRTAEDYMRMRDELSHTDPLT